MILKANITKKVNKYNNVFYGINIRKKEIEHYLKLLYNFLGKERYITFRKNKIKRDGLGFHLTIVPPQEVHSGVNFDHRGFFYLELIGIGQLHNKVYYIVVQSNDLDKEIEKKSLNKVNYHITLGFDEKDIHNFPKTKDTLIYKTDI